MCSETKTFAFRWLRYSARYPTATGFQRRQSALKQACNVVVLLATVLTWQTQVIAAENLTLRKGISFVNDTDSGFPIIADKSNDMTIASGKPTLIFFGAAGDLNTNRQAKRIVGIYERFKSKNVKFIIVDIDHPDRDPARALIKKFYRGYIPSQVVLDGSGSKIWEMTGEVSDKIIVKEIERLSKSDSKSDSKNDSQSDSQGEAATQSPVQPPAVPIRAAAENKP